MGVPWGLRTLAGLKWTRAERGCAPAGYLMVVHGLYLAAILGALSHPLRASFLDVDFLKTQVLVYSGFLAFATLLVGMGLWLRRHHPDVLWYQHLSAHFFTLSLVWTGYLTGSLSFATGVVLIGGPLLGYIILERRVILPAFLFAFSLVVALNFASASGWVPYAPALRAPTTSDGALWWTHAGFLVAAPHMLVSVVATALMIGQWRTREAEVLRLGMTDVLTGLPNRRSILRALAKTLRQPYTEHDLCIALLDLDHFKQINDRWGHAVGDRVLVEAAAALRRVLGPARPVGRFGGEEFLILMPGMSASQALDLLEQCRQALACLGISAPDGSSVATSASFGVAASTHCGRQPLETWIATADQALYTAKREGRDRVVLAPAPAREHRPALRQDEPAPGHRRSPGGWRRLQLLLKGGQRLSPVGLTSLMTALAGWQYCLYGLWGLYVLQRDDAAQLVDLDFMVRLIPILILCIGGAATLTLIGRRLMRTRPDSAVFQHVCQQYYGLTLIGFGYVVGIMSLPAGLLLVGTPVLGFIFFRRRYVIASLVSSVAAIVALAYASALGWIPYAPLVPAGASPWHFIEPFWVLSLFFFVLPSLVAIVVLADRTLGDWRQRGSQIRAMSITDALTRVHNRRSILERLDRELSRARRKGTPVALVSLDLDHFKQINDTRGHPTGDRVLREAASRLVASVRDGDSVGRVGGEEFLLLLPGTALVGALALAERCRAELEETELKDDAGATFTISASFGVVVADPLRECSAEALLKAADEALYRAKAAGRNRVEAAASAACPA